MTRVASNDAFPIEPPIEPMLAKLSEELPSGEGFLYEPKWDGFRAILFRGAGDVYIQSRDLRPLDRYFPELHETFLRALPDGIVLDGEIVITGKKGLDFDALQLRLHPAASRAAKLAKETPASFVAFDLLAVDGRDIRGRPLRERRASLETTLARVAAPIHVTPATRDRGTAVKWLQEFEGAGLDGVIAKPEEGIYEPGKRAMIKVKHVRTADCVVAGFRWHKSGKDAIGSLLLGLYDHKGTLHHVGVTSAFTMQRRRELVKELEPLRKNALKDHPWREWADAAEGQAGERNGATRRSGSEWSEPKRGAGGDRREAAAPSAKSRMPGGQSRWSAGKDLSWEPLRIERVCEVKYDHLQGDRFRHGTHFLRWRPDKRPDACRYDQLEVTTPYELEKVFGAVSGS